VLVVVCNIIAQTLLPALATAAPTTTPTLPPPHPNPTSKPNYHYHYHYYYYYPYHYSTSSLWLSQHYHYYYPYHYHYPTSSSLFSSSLSLAASSDTRKTRRSSLDSRPVNWSLASASSLSTTPTFPRMLAISGWVLP
jgi:hypothetical protein